MSMKIQVMVYLDESTRKKLWLRSTKMPNEVLYTVEDIARLLSVHPETVRKWIKAGELRAIKLGGPAGYRISQSAYEQFLREREDAALSDDK
jgi:excisionase family DNA binding protein